jgi:hypothetical protein
MPRVFLKYLRSRSQNLELLKILSKHYKLLKTSFPGQFQYAEFEFHVSFSILHFPDMLYLKKLELRTKNLSLYICCYNFLRSDTRIKVRTNTETRVSVLKLHQSKFLKFV